MDTLNVPTMETRAGESNDRATASIPSCPGCISRNCQSALKMAHLRGIFHPFRQILVWCKVHGGVCMLCTLYYHGPCSPSSVPISILIMLLRGSSLLCCVLWCRGYVM